MEQKQKIYYRCDCRACPEGCNTRSGGECDLTTNPAHARNFEPRADGSLVEKPDGRNLHLDDTGPYMEE